MPSVWLIIRCSIVFAIFLASFVQADGLDSSQNITGFDVLHLNGDEARYSLASMKYSSGFIPVDENMTLEGAVNQTNFEQSYQLKPDFKRHNRYWLYTKVINETDTWNWVLHISNFGFKQSQVLLQDSDGQVVHSFGATDQPWASDINTIGRAIELQLEPGKPYLLVVELNANSTVWYPYIGLMAERSYQRWKTAMDFTYKIAIGIIIGMLFLGFVCWILLSDKTFFWAALSSLIMLCFYLEHSSIPALFGHVFYEKTTWFWLLASCMLLSQLAFAATFLQVKRSSGMWFYVFAGAGLFILLVCIVSPWCSFRVNILLYTVNYITVWLVIFSSGIAKIRSEGRYYVMYIIGWFPLMVSVLETLLMLFFPKTTEHQLDVSYKTISVLYIQIFHMVIHVIALVQRIKVMRDEKYEAVMQSRAKSRFMAQSSHDLRQPLHSMKIFLDYLKPHIKNADAKLIFSNVVKTHGKMNESFNSIMELNKLEAGAVKAEFRPILLSDLFLKLQQEYEVQAAAKNIQLRFVSHSYVVNSDPQLLLRILRNLISNAIKYTVSGKVLIGCRRQAGNVSIQVLDTGCGISLETQSSMFNIYQRSLETTAGIEGFGIGLSIVKCLADLLNHPIHVRSVVGQGSIFSITVPRLVNLLSPINAPYSTNAASSGRYELTIGLVLQNVELENTVLQYVEKWCESVQLFTSLEALKRAQVPVDVIICDGISLSATSLSIRQIEQLAQDYTSACVCEQDVPVPNNWTTLSYPIIPSQTKALLNYANRRLQNEAKMVSETDSVSNIVPTLSSG